MRACDVHMSATAAYGSDYPRHPASQHVQHSHGAKPACELAAVAANTGCRVKAVASHYSSSKAAAASANMRPRLALTAVAESMAAVPSCVRTQSVTYQLQAGTGQSG